MVEKYFANSTGIHNTRTDVHSLGYFPPYISDDNLAHLANNVYNFTAGDNVNRAQTMLHKLLCSRYNVCARATRVKGTRNFVIHIINRFFFHSINTLHDSLSKTQMK